MKIALLNVSCRKDACVNKDFMGGYGWAFNAGKSFPARLISIVKLRGESLPIMSFGYIAAILLQIGNEVEYAENSVPSADIVIMQSSMVEHGFEISWAKRLRALGKTIGFIGPFSSAMPELFLEHCDFVVDGEPEDAFYRMTRGEELKGIVKSNPIADLDSLPFPRWDVFPYKEYSYFPALREKPFLPVLSSRGCSYGCNYCPYLVHYPKWRGRSHKNVLDEIGYLIDRFGMRAMLFRDPVFTLDRERTERIATGMLDREYKIKWACETRIDKVDKDLLKTMYRSGLRVINIGIESYSEDVIKRASRKPVDMEYQEEMIRYCDEIGIRVTAFYMVGMPDDTKESIENTIKYAKRLNTHVAQFFVFTPFPGTDYYDAVKLDIHMKGWESFDCYTPVFNHKNLSDRDILRLKERAFVSYYYRPAWAVKFASRAFRDMVNR